MAKESQREPKEWRSRAVKWKASLLPKPTSQRESKRLVVDRSSAGEAPGVGGGKKMSNGQQQMKRIVQNFYSALVVIDTVADTHTHAQTYIHMYVCKYVCCAGKKQN